MGGITGLQVFEVIFGYMTSYSTYIHTLLYSSSLEALPPYVKIKIIIMKTIYNRSYRSWAREISGLSMSVGQNEAIGPSSPRSTRKY